MLGDVDENEIDACSARLFSRGEVKDVIILRAGSVKKENEEYVLLNLKIGNEKDKRVLIPFWCRHHWLLLEVFHNVATLYDSAPSDVVRREVNEWCTKRGLSLRVGRCPQQKRYSRECGIFVIGFLTLLAHKRDMRRGIVSLHHVRERLQRGEHPTVEMFEELCNTTLQGAGEKSDKWIAIHQKYERWAAERNLCFLLCAFLLACRCREEEGGKGKYVSEKSLLDMAMQCGVAMKEDRAEQSDVEGALLKMKELQLFAARILMPSEIHLMKIGEIAVIFKNFNEFDLPTNLERITTINHTPANWEIYDNGTSKHRTAGDHYDR